MNIIRFKRGQHEFLGLRHISKFGQLVEIQCSCHWIDIATVKKFQPYVTKDELEVLMEPNVLLNHCFTFKILNLKFHNDNVGNDITYGILSQFFLSKVTLTTTLKVDSYHFVFIKFGLGSANPNYDMLFGTTLGTNVIIPLGKGVLTMGFTSTQTISFMSKNVIKLET